MSVQITAPELAGALDRLGIADPAMSSQELAECLLVEAITARLQAERMAELCGCHTPARPVADHAASDDHSRGLDDSPAPYGRV